MAKKNAAAAAAPAPAPAAKTDPAATYRLSSFGLDRSALAKKIGQLGQDRQVEITPLLGRTPPAYTLDEVVTLSELVFTPHDEDLIKREGELPQKDKVLAWHAKNNRAKQEKVLTTVQGILSGTEKVPTYQEGNTAVDRTAALAKARAANEAKRAAAQAAAAANPAPAKPAPAAKKAAGTTAKETVASGTALSALKNGVEGEALFEIPAEEVNEEASRSFEDQKVPLHTLQKGRTFWIAGTELDGKVVEQNEGSTDVVLRRVTTGAEQKTYISPTAMVVPGKRPKAIK